MLLEEFDYEKNAVINPDAESIDFPEITISCFSSELFNKLLNLLEHRKIAENVSCNGINPIYEVFYKNNRFAFYRSYIGAAMCVGDYEEIIARGSKCLILFGNCGVLDRNIEDCGIIIPTSALRDEGCSYHYAPASDSISVNNKYIQEFKEVLDEHHYSYTEGMTWTTDAFYRETPKKIERRKQQGAICVEMECSAMQALCDFRETDFFQFLYAGDNLDGNEWDERSLNGMTRLDDKTKIGFLAFELAMKITEKQ